MKKIIIVLLLGVFCLTACGEKKEEKKDYSEYLFTDVTWTRENDHDSETLKLNADGSFSYSCACGNPVNDADLCEVYTYDEDKKEIKLDCFETTDETITTIKVVESTKDTLKLDFNGEIREFTKEK